jgi:hypothetical protein
MAARLVAAAALVSRGPGRIERPWIGNARLCVGIVAVATVQIVLIGLQRLPSVSTRLHFGEHRIMAAGALLRVEAAAGELIDVGRIRVQFPFADAAVAVQAHDLPVRRDMPPFLVHQPICAGTGAHAN